MELLIAGAVGIAIGFSIIGAVNKAGHGPKYVEPEPKQNEGSGGGCLKLIIVAIVLAFTLPVFFGGQ